MSGKALSQPTRAAWIEIYLFAAAYYKQKSQPTRAAWIEIKEVTIMAETKTRSQPTRAAWIEIII